MPNGSGNMPNSNVYNLKGINTKISPFSQTDGQITHCLNMYTDLIGAKRKRPGYVTFLGTAEGSAVNTMFQYLKEDGTTNYLYRASGSKVYWYNEGAGTGDWTLATNGTISAGAKMGATTFDDVLICGDGVGATRHTTVGTSFTDTTLAPIGRYFAQEFNRVFIAGTASDLFYSSPGNGTDWAGTSDSSSMVISGPGKLNGVWSVADRIVATKTSGIMRKWDDYALTRVPTTKGYASYDSVGDIDGYLVGLNRLGYFGFGGGRPEIISNPVVKHIYNNSQSGIAGTVFANAPAGVYRYQYLASVGTITDEYTQHQIPDCVMVYDYQLDEWFDYRYFNRPTSFLNYLDKNGDEQLIFGDAVGQVYKLAGTATSDNGNPIECQLEGFIHLSTPERDKVWKKVEAFANPGCEAQIMFGASDTFDITKVQWGSSMSLRSGCSSIRRSIRGRFLFYRVIESSITAPFEFYGFSVEADFIGD